MKVPTVSNIANIIFDRFINSEIDSYDRAAEAEMYLEDVVSCRLSPVQEWV